MKVASALNRNGGLLSSGGAGLVVRRLGGLILDGITAFEPGRRMVAYTDLSATQDYADDAFPRGGAIPNSILVEITVQAASLFLGRSNDFRVRAVPIMLHRAQFARSLRPGARFTVENRLCALAERTALVHALGTSEGDAVMEADVVMGFGSEEGGWMRVDPAVQRSYFDALMGPAGPA
jgi:3-hydroxymyristoyl/3-hydroxydecanoyl-(acyl carrier protein) dehydratase